MSFIKTNILLLFTIAFSSSAFTRPIKTHYSESDTARISNQFLLPEKVNLQDSIINFGKLFLNTPYGYGSGGVNSFDCSGFTSHVYRNFGVNLHRSSSDQATQFPVIDKNDIKPGDLVFYEGRSRNGRVGHVGIVTEIKDNGDFDFIHASVNKGVIITNSKEDYYTKRFVQAGRVMENDSVIKIMSAANLNRSEFVSNSPSQSVKKVIPAKYHYVKRGETLSSIASKYSLSIAQLKKRNGINKDILQIKQRLLIKEQEVVVHVQPVLASKATSNDSIGLKMPVGESEADVCLSTTKHVVERGETFYSISKKYGVTVADIKRLNKSGNNKLYPGQTLVLSEEQPTIAQNVTPKSEMTTIGTNVPTEANGAVKKAEPLKVASTVNTESAVKTEVKSQPLIQPQAVVEVAKAEPKTKEPKTKSVVAKKDKVVLPNLVKEEVHMVRSGESLMSIARKYNSTIDELKALNGLSGNVVEIGQILVIHTNDPNYFVKTKPNVQNVEPLKVEEPKVLAEQLTPKTEPKIQAKTEPKTESKTQVKAETNIKVEKPVQSVTVNEEKPQVQDAKPIIHKVHRGESLYSIAKQYDMTIDQLKELNELTSVNLQAGQKLKVSTAESVNVASKKAPVKKETTITHKVKRGENYSTIAKHYGCKVSDIKNWNNRTSDRLDVGDKLVIKRN